VARSAIQIGASGAADDRRFFIVDERGRLINGKHVGELSTVVASLSHGELSLAFPDGAAVDGVVALGAPFETRFFSSRMTARPLLGPWSDALSAYFGRTLRIVAGVQPSVDRGRRGAVSLISRASLDGLAQVAGEAAVDARRFRMLVEIDGVPAHAEDAWPGVEVRIGAALVRFAGHVGRCSITTRHPETGIVDLPTLDLLRFYRGELDTTEPLPFGVYGEVLEGGLVSVGDPVVVEAA
jgi:uncharacterized protein YcbX